MKKHLFILLILAVGVGCNDGSNFQGEIVKKDMKQINVYAGIQTIEYAGCEYVFIPNSDGNALCHKGNCKYCAERNKKTK